LLPVFFVCLVFIGFLTTFNSLDPDFGWHLRTGKSILEEGVPYKDWYSYTMPDFPWIDHEWLMDVLIYKIYSSFGFYFLLLVFIILYTLSFFFVGEYHRDFWGFVLPVALGYLATVGFLGIRPQLLTILFIAIVWKITNEFLNYSSGLIYPVRNIVSNGVYILPVLFLVWVNLHGGFFGGFFILFIFLILEIFKKLKIHQKIKTFKFLDNFYLKEQPFSKILILGSVIFFSFLATMANPYGLRIYEEVFRTAGDNFLRFHIQEWLPLFFLDFKPLIYIYIGFFTGFLIISYREIEFNSVVFALIFLILSLSGARYFLIFIIITIPIFQKMFYSLKGKINIKETYRLTTGLGKSMAALFFAVLLLMFSYSIYGFSKDALNIQNYYPEKSLSFLKTLPLSENLFNYYGWGGYLIWKLPERKYFIDGRMPSWRQNGQFVFGDYIDIMKAKEGFEKILEKYNVNLVLIQKIKEETKSVQKNTNAKSFLKNRPWLSRALGVSENKNLYNELINLNWKIIYRDEVAVILRK